jgi:LPS sulfotransferase NodH
MNEIQGRIFLVGCPRSGTTLLQSLLAAHPQIASFPESHFFTSLAPAKPWLRKLPLGLASGNRARSRFVQFLHLLNQEPMQQELPKFAPFMRQYSKAFVRVLDKLTIEQGKTWWLEKTPAHLQCIDLIEKLIPDAKFVHLTRNGADVVASLYEVAQHNHASGWKEPGDIDKCVDRWLDSMAITRRTLSEPESAPQHTLVQYEQLVANPQPVLTQLCEFLGLAFEESMLQEYQAAAKKVVRKDETWKAAASQPIANANGKKFYQVFDTVQRQHILMRLNQKV